jgi:diguanylate cyclase (GGDEF)-like protein/putative nucleotidyltransferase with HDIG domain
MAMKSTTDLWGAPKRDELSLPGAALAFVIVQLVLGLPLLPYALYHWQSQDRLRFLCFLAIALTASLFKVRLPGINATMSANFLFILVGILDLTYPETLLMGCLGGLFQSVWRAHPRPRVIQLLFNLANLALSITTAYLVFHSHIAQSIGLRWPLLLAVASTAYFAVNTGSVSAVIALTEGRNAARVWKECYLWSFPYYLLGALIAGAVSVVNNFVSWQVSILVFPVVYWMYRSYRTYLGRLEAEKKHAEEIAALHLRTIEALSLAIEAKDYTTHAHLRRVEVYAVEICKDLGATESELNAIRAAALLHDIGKLAVPEHILSKPGRLTPEEYEKMKIHPVVGSQILDRVEFPYPVVPIVRSHHEKWDGTGYPDGFKGEEIPIGARILAAVDCFDALSSERPYRRAISPEDAMKYLRSEAGRSYDPRVVEAIGARYVELEKMVCDREAQRKQLDIPSKIGRHVIPSTGFAEEPAEAAGHPGSFLASIVSAREEAQLLFELTQTLGNSLSLKETLSVVAVRLKKMIPHDSIVVFVCLDGMLVPEYVHGLHYDFFSSIQIPLGHGLSGWVALNEKPIVNGNPAAETTLPGKTNGIPLLQSALSVPLRGRDGVAGVLSLYQRERNSFTSDHLRMLLATSSKLGLSVENAVRFEKAQNSASTDFLTGLPNARSLCVHLEKEIARCRRNAASLAVLMCDLNGFKKVNDRFGHLAGNKLLQEVAAQLRLVCRPYDFVGRLGGDEFVFILPELSAEGLEELELRLKDAMRKASQNACGEITVSFSIGCAMFPNDGAQVEELLAEADRRMYESKDKHYLLLEGASAILPEPAERICFSLPGQPQRSGPVQ